MGIQLQSGWNEVQYLGPCTPYGGLCYRTIEDAIASIKSYITIIWTPDGSEYYDPNDPGSNLQFMYYGFTYRLNMSQAVYWNWDSMPPPDPAFADISNWGELALLLTSPQPEGKFISFSIEVKNTGGTEALCYLEPYNVTGALMGVSGSMSLAPGAKGYFVISFTMNNMDVTFSLRSWHHDGVGYDDYAGPFTIPLATVPAKVSNLEVGYAIA